MMSAIALAAAVPAPAAAEDFACPRLTERKVDGRVDAPGWQVTQTADAVEADRVGLFSGPPAERAQLVPDRTRRAKTTETDVWRLAPDARGYWIACFYPLTSSLVARPVAASARTCSASYARMPAGYRLSITAIVCR